MSKAERSSIIVAQRGSLHFLLLRFETTVCQIQLGSKFETTFRTFFDLVPMQN